MLLPFTASEAPTSTKTPSRRSPKNSRTEIFLEPGREPLDAVLRRQARFPLCGSTNHTGRAMSLGRTRVVTTQVHRDTNAATRINSTTPNDRGRIEFILIYACLAQLRSLKYRFTRS